MLTANMKMIAECADKLAHLGEKLFNKTEMKYRAGNKVRVKSLDWYNENKGMNGLVGLFTPSMVKLCGMVVTLDSAYNGKYTAIETEAKGYYLDDSMIEGLAEGLTQEEFAVEWATFDFNKTMNDIIRKRREENLRRIEQTLEGAMLHTGVICPDGYEFKDENGNVIEAKKIVLEEKKPKYPKSLSECMKIIGFKETYGTFGYKAILLRTLQDLLICRDAYWKIAGDWKPEWYNDEKKYCIYGDMGKITRNAWSYCNAILAFPTEEMRDAFYENFKDSIEICKELL